VFLKRGEADADALGRLFSIQKAAHRLHRSVLLRLVVPG
jgi:hypothetical protein